MVPTQEITGNKVKSYNVRGSCGVGWGQGEIVCEGHWLKSLI